VKDLARGIVLVGKRGRGDGYALGHTKAYSILQIAKAFDGPVKLTRGYAGRAEARNDVRKARALGWKPTIDVMDYIRAIVEAH
jgi:UDP-glucose 4-epimerase